LQKEFYKEGKRYIAEEKNGGRGGITRGCHWNIVSNRGRDFFSFASGTAAPRSLSSGKLLICRSFRRGKDRHIQKKGSKANFIYRRGRKASSNHLREEMKRSISLLEVGVNIFMEIE